MGGGATSSDSKKMVKRSSHSVDPWAEKAVLWIRQSQSRTAHWPASEVDGAVG